MTSAEQSGTSIRGRRPGQLAAHPLAQVLRQAVQGRFPPADGSWSRLEPWRDGVEAVVAFTGHAVVVATPELPEARLADLGIDGLGRAHDPRIIAELAGEDAWIDTLDMLLVTRGFGGRRGSTRLVERPDLADHPRVEFAQRLRDHVKVFGYPEPGRKDVLILSRGIAGLLELSFELEPTRRGGGHGTTLVRDGLRLIRRDELVVAASAPGNAAAVRALLAVGFIPVGSVQLFCSGARPVAG